MWMEEGLVFSAAVKEEIRDEITETSCSGYQGFKRDCSSAGIGNNMNETKIKVEDGLVAVKIEPDEDNMEELCPALGLEDQPSPSSRKLHISGKGILCKNHIIHNHGSGSGNLEVKVEEQFDESVVEDSFFKEIDRGSGSEKFDVVSQFECNDYNATKSEEQNMLFQSGMSEVFWDSKNPQNWIRNPCHTSIDKGENVAKIIVEDIKREERWTESKIEDEDAIGEVDADLAFEDQAGSFICDIKTKDNVNNKTHKCEYCTYEAKKKTYLRRHVKRKHDINSESYKCEYCTFETKYKYNFDIHIEMKHDKNIIIHKCTQCTFETKYKGYLTKHIRRKHEMNGELYKCKDCTYETTYKQELMRHAKREHDETGEIYKCKHCAYETKDRSYLAKHMKLKHCEKNETFKCKSCSYETNIEYYLRRHIKIMHDENFHLFRCNICTYEAKYRQLLVKHFERTHQGKASKSTAKSH